MRRECAWCGLPFDAQRSSARFCSGAHRAAAHKARADAPVAAVAGSGAPGQVYGATRALLRARGLSPTDELSSVALAVAQRLDDPLTPTSALSGVYDAMRTVLALIEKKESRT